MTQTWHVDPPLARSYADSLTDPVLTASLEQHLLGCADCRRLVGSFVDAEPLEQNWSAVLDRVLTPRPLLLERVLGRLGVEHSAARLLALTPSLRGAWLTGVVLVLCVGVAMAYAGPHQTAAFLAVVPLLPAVSVAFAFSPALDPTHEIAAAAPYSFVRLLAARTTLVIAATMVPTALACAVLPVDVWLGTAWLLPGLALSAGTLALSSHLPPVASATGLGLCWLAVIGNSMLPRGNPEMLADPAVQLACLAVLAASVLAIVADRHRLSDLIRRIP